MEADYSNKVQRNIKKGVLKIKKEKKIFNRIL